MFSVITAVNKLQVGSYSDLCSSNSTCLNFIVKRINFPVPMLCSPVNIKWKNLIFSVKLEYQMMSSAPSLSTYHNQNCKISRRADIATSFCYYDFAFVSSDLSCFVGFFIMVFNFLSSAMIRGNPCSVLTASHEEVVLTEVILCFNLSTCYQ